MGSMSKIAGFACSAAAAAWKRPCLSPATAAASRVLSPFSSSLGHRTTGNSVTTAAASRILSPISSSLGPRTTGNFASTSSAVRPLPQFMAIVHTRMFSSKPRSVRKCCCEEELPDSRIEGFIYKDCIPPESIDWRKKGVVTPVQNQMDEDCWAFAPVGAVEVISAIKTGKLIKLSEQQVIDCNDLSNGWADGGHPHLAFDYIYRNGGLVSEEAYPYVGRRCPCRKISSAEMVTIDGYQFVPKNCEFSLKQAVANQAIVVDICLDEQLLDYHGGIADDMGITGKPDHSALLIGYGKTSKGQKFWTIKDSRGTKHCGGIIHIARDIGNRCGAFGIASNACFPVKTSPNSIGTVDDDISIYVKMYGECG
ncbi:hypothetical protein EJB05_01293 [Eragrostis curvula]|uniref:Peptidase C1A papain C-terminal domain-containing protein n=1 Tax=Eragrostis curvula TaxID=38414 RepID=A0A5J9WPR4_9POAL|nr:hypothetical protein EJB05_01293 [Eragrostis curvula]